MIVVAVILVTSFALLAGAFWGAFRNLSERTEGFVVAFAGGALIVSVMDELIRPSVDTMPLWGVLVAVMGGAAIFTGSDAFVAARFRNAGGTGLVLAVTLDGVPENLALGTALIGAQPLAVAALAGSIFLSNLPEAAGGAKRMVADGRHPRRVVAVWAGVATLLSLAALGGYTGLSDASEPLIATIKCIAAGAVAASLATEVFPTAFREDAKWTGIAVALGLCFAVALGQLG
ncbi:ZIP family metal transporter [Maritimibacter sp. DP1N21-5]|uniref:ZIP family metal transporter n=1 Tax=Maritimibacter sp. DP1N21-5 TaxID=2836867 RepID=UPI001C46E9D2|nr:zinc transporter [Maritimibacter sp. DP1N21-5]MBV7408639.1 zinc transporter [Maritimibacter sp. DP1N21-5]